MDHAAVNEEERRQARRGVRADDVGGGGGGKEKKQEESKGAREEMTAEEDLKTDRKEGCDGLIGMVRWISGTADNFKSSPGEVAKASRRFPTN